VYEGVVKLTLGHETETVKAGKSVTIKPGVNHRIEALEDAVVLEVSTTELDDVVMLDDDYGRHRKKE